MAAATDPVDIPELGATGAAIGGFAAEAFFVCRFSFSGPRQGAPGDRSRPQLGFTQLLSEAAR